MVSTGAPNVVTTQSNDQNDPVRNIVVTIILGLLICATLILNICFLVCFGFTRKLRTPHNYLLASIAVADILSALLWLIPAAVTTATWTWLLGDEFCQFQGFAGTLFYGVNVFSILAIILEKFMKFWSPSRHKLAFTKLVSLILVFSLWIFSMVFAIIPLIGWGNYAYIEPRYHCVINFGVSFSLLNFFTVTAYGIPLLLGIILFLLICGKVTSSKRKVNSAGEIIVEEREDRIGETYGERLKRQEEKYKNVANCGSKPKLGKNQNDGEKGDESGDKNTDNKDTFDSDTDDSDWVESDNEEYYTDYADVIHKRREMERRMLQKRRYRLHRRDVKMTVTIFIMWEIYMVLWLPYMVLNYIWIYENYPDFNRTMHIIMMTLALASTFYKPLVYLTNGYMRKTVKAALSKRKKKRQKEKELKKLNKEYQENKKKTKDVDNDVPS